MPPAAGEFLRYIVQRRAAEGLNGLVLTEKDLASTTPGTQGRSWTRFTAAPPKTLMWPGWRRPLIATPGADFYHDPDLRRRAFALIDGVVRSRPTVSGTTAGWTATSVRTALPGQPGVERDRRRRSAPRRRLAQAVAKAADQGLIVPPLRAVPPQRVTGQYANPEMYLLSGSPRPGN